MVSQSRTLHKFQNSKVLWHVIIPKQKNKLGLNNNVKARVKTCLKKKEKKQSAGQLLSQRCTTHLAEAPKGERLSLHHGSRRYSPSWQERGDSQSDLCVAAKAMCIHILTEQKTSYYPSRPTPLWPPPISHPKGSMTLSKQHLALGTKCSNVWTKSGHSHSSHLRRF